MVSWFPLSAVKGSLEWTRGFVLDENSFGLLMSPGHVAIEALGPGGAVWSKTFPDPANPAGWSSWQAAGKSPLRQPPMEGFTALFTLGIDGQPWARVFPDPHVPARWSVPFRLGEGAFAVSVSPNRVSVYAMSSGGAIWSRSYVPGRVETPWTEWMPYPGLSSPGEAYHILWLASQLLLTDPRAFAVSPDPALLPPGSVIIAANVGGGAARVSVIGIDDRTWSTVYPDPLHPTAWTDWFPSW
ncbi:MAG: hypothetical protein HYZ57_10210 [Acidobacteria bacterium]|nr:hypothetical protein [Acidobacteriota bacterium]MBI3280202.1 hypothetical protein [Acidobacteriota bacterium]